MDGIVLGTLVGSVGGLISLPDQIGLDLLSSILSFNFLDVVLIDFFFFDLMQLVFDGVGIVADGLLS